VIQIEESRGEIEPVSPHPEVYVKGKIINCMYEYEMNQIDNSYDDQHLKEEQIYKLLKGVTYQRALLESKPF
jgi:hypothetical protein